MGLRRLQCPPPRRFRRQDIKNGDPSTLCSGGECPSCPHLSAFEDTPPRLPGLNLTFFLPLDSSHPALLERKVFGVEGGSAFLECEPRSLQAHVEWTFQRAGEGVGTPVSLGGGALPTRPLSCPLHLGEAPP